jgi:crotonobetainyl-CoA:carnitine CoA-transferase CaiB-like acyl-CoA transferase
VTGALEGLRVIDLSPTRLGAQVSQLFADFGAEVIWVEPPGGAPMRHQPAFAFWARGKRSVELDLGTDDGRDALRALVAGADVLIETFRPGVMDRLGFDPDALAALNPRLVHTSITGFGHVGPYAGLQGYEGIVAAKLGVFQAFNRMVPDDRPPFVNVPWCTWPAIQTALHGTLSALIEREHSGLGQRVEASLAQAFTAVDTWGWFEQYIERKWPGAYKRANSYDEDEIPTTPFAYFLLIALTKDGHWLQFAQTAPRLYAALMRALGLDWMFTDPEWAGIPVFPDQQRREALWARMLEVANTKTLAEWQQVFEDDPDVFAEEFRAGPQVLEHPQVKWDGSAIELIDDERGPVHQPGPLVMMKATPADTTRSAPTVGRDQALVADALGGATPASAPASTGARADAPTGLPLDGMTIVEFAVQFAAPHGTTLLTDLGARVIKIEALEGDPIRSILPFPETGAAKVMAGKETICIDLGTPEGLALAHEIIARSDMVMQGFRAGVADRIGVGYERLRQLNPDLVYVNATGYGTGGPNGHRPAYAPSIGAAAGVARGNVGDLVEERAGMTLAEIRHGTFLLTVGAVVSNAQADGFAALGVGTAVLLGYLARQRGKGAQELTTTMINTNAHAMSAQVVDYPGSPGEPGPDIEMRGLSALYRSYDARDGWVFLAAPQDEEWSRLVSALAPYVDLADARFADRAARATNDEALAHALAGAFATRDKADWERDLRAADVACVAVTTSSIEDVLWSDDFAVASGYVTEADHPVFERHPRMAPLVRFSRSATKVGDGNLAGAHTDAILTELGRTPEQIADLRERKIVG